MRTTVDLEEDVLLAAKEIAVSRKVSLGKAISILVRRGVAQSQAIDIVDGIPLLPRREGSTIVTLETVNRLRDEQS